MLHGSADLGQSPTIDGQRLEFFWPKRHSSGCGGGQGHNGRDVSGAQIHTLWSQHKDLASGEFAQRRRRVRAIRIGRFDTEDPRRGARDISLFPLSHRLCLTGRKKPVEHAGVQIKRKFSRFQLGNLGTGGGGYFCGDRRAFSANKAPDLVFASEWVLGQGHRDATFTQVSRLIGSQKNAVGATLRRIQDSATADNDVNAGAGATFLCLCRRSTYSGVGKNSG